MFGSQVLDVLIGLFTLYLILSVMVSGFNEVMSGLLNSRGAMLMSFIQQSLGTHASKLSDYMVYDPDENKIPRLLNFIFGFPGLSQLRNRWSLPTRIEPDQFTQAFMEVVMQLEHQSLAQRLVDAPDKIDAVTTSVIESINKLKDRQLKNRLLQLVKNTSDSAKSAAAEAQLTVADAEKYAQNLRQQVEQQVTNWYQAQMDRLKELYTRNIKFVIFAIGLSIAFFLNIDSIKITNELLINPTLREAIVAQSQGLVENGTILDENNLQYIYDQLGNLGLSIGWTNFGQEISVMKIVGILITAFAVSQGAPFWFDLLNKVTNLKWGAKTPAEAAPTSSGTPVPPAAVLPASTTNSTSPATPSADS